MRGIAIRGVVDRKYTWRSTDGLLAADKDSEPSICCTALALVGRGIAVRKGTEGSTGVLGRLSSMGLEVDTWRFLFFDLAADVG